MKNILITVLIFTCHICAAQVYVNNIDVNKFDYQYIEMWEHFNKQNGKFHALIDYGQKNQDRNNLSFKVNERNGDPKEFNSIVAILNFLHHNGWELITIKSTGGIDSFIMKRIQKMAKGDNNASDTASNKSSDSKKKDQE